MKATSFLLWIHEHLVHDGNDPLADYMHTLRALIYWLTGEREPLTTEKAFKVAPGTHDAHQLLAHLEPAIADAMQAECGHVRKLERPHPLFPSPDTIDRMALRYRHDFGLLSASERDNIRTTMRQLYEEAHAPTPARPKEPEAARSARETLEYLHARYIEPALSEKAKWVATADYEWRERIVTASLANSDIVTREATLQRRWEYRSHTGMTLNEWRDVPKRPDVQFDPTRAAHFDTMVRA
jgi:hypothetical protein